MMLLLQLFAGVFLLTHGAAQIFYKQTNKYEKIWESPFSNVVSFWKPVPKAGFFSLGDVAVSGATEPRQGALFVTAISDGVLSAPRTLEYVWDDKGSGADNDITVYKMLPEEGFVCLGMIAYFKYRDVKEPDVSNYRCVNASYVTPGSSSKLWDDLGSSIYIKSAARSILRDSGSDGVNVQSFYFLTASKPVFSPMLLSSRFITPLTVVETDQASDKLAVLETSSMPDLMWKSYSGIGSASIHNPVMKDQSNSKHKFHRLGSVLVKGQNAPDRIYVVKGTFGESIAHPLNYTLAWSSMDTGARISVIAWKPLCPMNFTHIGLYATSTFSMPVNETVCVNERYTTPGKWSFSWASYMRGGNRAVLFTSLKTDSMNGLESQPFSYVPNCICYPEGPANLINMDTAIFIPKVHVTEYELRDVKYNLDHSSIISEKLSFVRSKAYSNAWDDQAMEIADSITVTSNSTYNWRISNIDVKPRVPVKATYPRLYIESSDFKLGAQIVDKDILFAEYINVEDTLVHKFKVTVPEESSKMTKFYTKTYYVDVPFIGSLLEHFNKGLPVSKNVKGTVSIEISSDFVLQTE